MLLIPSNVAMPIEVTYDSPALYVGLRVFDMSSGSPIAVGGVLPMSNVPGTNSYVRNFTPAQNKQYFFSKQVYTDNSYSVLDTDYAAGTDSAFASDMLTTLTDILNRVNIQSGIESNLVGYLFYDVIKNGPLGENIPIDIIQGAGAVLNAKFLQVGSKDPLDLTGVAEIECCFLNDDGTELMLSMTDGEIAVLGNPILGKMSLTLTAEQTAALAIDDNAPLQVTVTYGSGQPKTIQIPRAYNIIQTLC